MASSTGPDTVPGGPVPTEDKVLETGASLLQVIPLIFFKPDLPFSNMRS